MRALCLSLALLAIGYSSRATNYYFSATTGNDSRTSAQATNPSSPWRTLSKLNSFFPNLKPGDSVLFKRGDTFYGSIAIKKSGTSLDPIVLGAYGSGRKPVITGLTTLSDWASVGNGVYESGTVLPVGARNLVLINGAVQEMGRYPNSNAPNKGYLYLESHNSTSSITDEELGSSPNWKGAEMVIRSWKSAFDRVTITSHYGGKLSGDIKYEPHDGFGYFIQNDIRTLDKMGEWYYNKGERKMNVFFGSNNPSSYNVRVSTKDTLVYASDRTYVSFNNLSFQGANQAAVYLRYCKYINITGCEFLYSGNEALSLNATSHLTVTNNYFNQSLTNAFDVNISGDYWTVHDNVINNTAMYEGLCQKGDQVGYAIYSKGSNHTIERNVIDSTGFMAIRFSGNNILIKNNVITYFNMIKNDGGGIYSWRGGTTNRKIVGNILMYGYGANEGIGLSNGSSCSGIYFDNSVTGVELIGNTVTNCSKTGVYIHNSYGIKLKNNTLFNNTRQITMTHDDMASAAPLRNLDLKRNIFFAKTAGQYASSINTYKDDVDRLGNIDSNYYCRPVDETFINYVSYYNSAGKKFAADYDLKGWQEGFYPFDKHSKKTARQLQLYTVNSLIGSNKVVNGTFSSDIDNVYTNGVSSWLSSKLDGGTLQGTISSLSSLYQVIMSVGSVTANKKYVLRFSLQSTQDTVFNAYLRTPGSPYTAVTDMVSFNVGTTRKDYEFVFSAEASLSSAIVALSTRAKDLKFWIDNVKLYEADVTNLDLNKQIRFEYNPTNAAKTIRLASDYVDVKNNSYSGSVTLQPYSSIILLKSGASTAEEVALAFAKTSQTVEAEQGDTKTLVNTVTTSDNFPVTVQLKALDNNGKVPSWLTLDDKTLNGVSVTGGSKISFSVDATSLATGTYTAKVTATASDYKSDILDVQFTVVKTVSEDNRANLQVNFQDQATETPAGWLADFGQPYGARTSPHQGSGNTYGWIEERSNTPLDLTMNGRKRNSPSSVLKATLMHMQSWKVEEEGRWEAKVANGDYDVTVSVGDNDYFDSRHTINVESTPAIVDFVPSPTTPFKTATISVSVSDGKLTIDAIGGRNAKLNYIIIKPSTDQENIAAKNSVNIAATEQALTANRQNMDALEEANAAGSLRIKQVYPNPSRSYFNVAVQGSSAETVSLYVYDYAGRLLESKSGIAPNSTIQVGQQLPRGMYVVQVMQGTRKAETKMTKL